MNAKTEIMQEIQHIPLTTLPTAQNYDLKIVLMLIEHNYSTKD